MKRFPNVATNTDDESPSNGSSSAAAIAASSAVGETLKSARERMGKPLAEVASQLRIRQPYLLALEEGRNKDLPGGTYAIGFLRTYAEFLGLDGEEMVRRFRQDSASELQSRSELAFPSPVSEGRIPSGGILFLGLVVAAFAYGGWYWMTAREARVAEIVPPLPERLSSALNRPASLTADKVALAKLEEPRHPDEMTKPQEAGPVDAAKPPVHEEVVPPSEEEEPAKPAEAVKAPEPAKPAETVKAPEPAKPAETVKAPEPAKPAETVKAPEPPAKPVVVVKTPEPAKPVAKAPEPAKPVEVVKPADPVKPVEAVKAPEPVKPSELVKALDAPKAPEPAKPVEAAKAPVPTASGDSRVALRALADDCWVQVREMDGQLLMSRLLRKGDVFQVPNRPGLTLTAGNSGALEISVDGQALPALGLRGQVRHDISLDPAKLRAGG